MQLNEDQVLRRTNALLAEADSGGDDWCPIVSRSPAAVTYVCRRKRHNVIEACEFGPMCAGADVQISGTGFCVLPLGHRPGHVFAVLAGAGGQRVEVPEAEESVELAIDRWTPAVRFQGERFTIEWLEPPSGGLLERLTEIAERHGRLLTTE